MQRGKCDDPNPKTSSRYSKYAGTFLVRLDFPPAPDPKPARQVVEILDPRPGRGRQQQEPRSTLGYLRQDSTFGL
jgi:hypothetical protein